MKKWNFEGCVFMLLSALLVLALVVTVVAALQRGQP